MRWIVTCIFCEGTLYCLCACPTSLSISIKASGSSIRVILLSTVAMTLRACCRKSPFFLISWSPCSRKWANSSRSSGLLSNNLKYIIMTTCNGPGQFTYPDKTSLNDKIISVLVSNNVFVLRVIMYDKDKPICNLIHYFTRAMTSMIPPMLLYWLVIFYDTWVLKGHTKGDQRAIVLGNYMKM